MEILQIYIKFKMFRSSQFPCPSAGFPIPGAVPGPNFRSQWSHWPQDSNPAAAGEPHAAARVAALEPVPMLPLAAAVARGEGGRRLGDGKATGGAKERAEGVHGRRVRRAQFGRWAASKYHFISLKEWKESCGDTQH